jgi:hypothetical protein
MNSFTFRTYVALLKLYFAQNLGNLSPLFNLRLETLDQYRT